MVRPKREGRSARVAHIVKLSCRVHSVQGLCTEDRSSAEGSGPCAVWSSIFNQL